MGEQEPTGAPATGTDSSSTPPPAVSSASAPVEGAAPATGATTPPAPATPDAPRPGDAALTDDDAHWQWLEQQDLAALVKRHKGLTGKIGELAKKQAEKMKAEEAEADRLRKEEEDRLAKEREFEEALENDPYKATEILKDKRAAEKEQKLFLGGLDAFLNRMFLQLPEEARSGLYGKEYFGKPMEARMTYLSDIIEAMSEHKSTKKLAGQLKDEREKWEKEWERSRAPAIRQDALGDLHRDEPSPEVGGGLPSAGRLTDGEFEANFRNPTWRRENKARVDQYLADRHQRAGTRR